MARESDVRALIACAILRVRSICLIEVAPSLKLVVEVIVPQHHDSTRLCVPEAGGAQHRYLRKFCVTAYGTEAVAVYATNRNGVEPRGTRVRRRGG